MSDLRRQPVEAILDLSPRILGAVRTYGGCRTIGDLMDALKVTDPMSWQGVGVKGRARLLNIMFVLNNAEGA